MSTPSSTHTSLVERLFRVGAHFGFKKSRRHPTTVPFILGSKNGNDIFDLNRTAADIANAQAILREAGANGKTVLFVGTKDETRQIIRETAERVDSPYVVNRWIGGMLTNWGEIKKRLNRLEELTRERISGELERKYTKRERVMIGREVDKLSFNFSGMATLQKLPDLLVIVDPRHDHIAVAEARELGLPTIGIMSSDCDAAAITHPIVVNDALQSSVTLVLGEIASALAEGRAAATPATPATTPEATSQRSAAPSRA